MSDTAYINIIRQPVRSVPALIRLGTQKDASIVFMDKTGIIIPYGAILTTPLIDIMDIIHSNELWFETKIRN